MSDYGYRFDYQEYFTCGFASEDDALEEARALATTEDLTVSVGEAVNLTANQMVMMLDDVEDALADRLYDNLGENASDNLSISVEAKEEYFIMMENWIKRHNLFGVKGFGTMKNVREYSLTNDLQ